MIRRILVPLDGSHFAEHAIPHAVAIARRTGATLDLMSVVTPPFSSNHLRGVRLFDDEVMRETAAAHQQYLAACAGRVRERHGVACEEIVHVGSVLERLVEHMADADVDLIAMTTHGGGSPTTSWLGSVSDRLVREATVPLLLVRPSTETDVLGSDPVPSCILVPSDGSAVSGRVLDHAVHLAALFGARLTIFAAVVGAAADTRSPLAPKIPAEERLLEAEARRLRDRLEAMAERARDQAVDVTVLVERHTHAATAIAEVAAREGAELLAMSTHGRGGVRRMLLGSVADKVLRTSPVPILLTGPSMP